jgi:molybdenum cofactor biosynthesis enzyme MoaA
VGLAVGDACNNGCRACVWTRRLSFRPAVGPDVDVAGWRVELGGREPTVREDLPDVVRSLVERGAAEIELSTNGRRFVYPGYAHKLYEAGLDAVSVKLFGVTEAAWVEHTRVPGSYSQTLKGLTELSRVRGLRVTGVAYPGRAAGTAVDDFTAFATSIGLGRLRLVLELPKQDLLGLGALEARLEGLRESPLELSLDVSE